jgi:hypothetical protein
MADINIPKLQTPEIDQSITIPKPTVENSLYGIKEDLLLKSINYGLGELGVKGIPNYDVNDIVDTYVPDLSDYKIYLNNLQMGDEKQEEYTDGLQKLVDKFANTVSKSLYSIVDKARQGANAIDRNAPGDILPGGIPQGYAYTINNGKMRWESIDWTKVDPILASYGIIKVDPTLRPDLNMDKLGFDKKNAVEPRIPKGKISIGGQEVDWGIVRWFTLTNKFGYGEAKSRQVQKGNTTETIYYFDYQGDSIHVDWEPADSRGALDPHPDNAANVKPYFDSFFTNPKLNNRSAEFLMSSGADFIKNMYDVAFVLTIPDNDKEIMDIVDKGFPLCNDIYFNHVLNGAASLNSLLMVRTSSINIPQMENDTFTIKWLNQNITKVRSKVKYERKAELKMLLDEPLYMRLLINILSGTSRAGKMEIDQKNYGHMPTHLSPGDYISPYNLNILVKHEALLHNPYFEELKETWRKTFKDGLETGFAGPRPAELPIWWFQDVKFLGEGSDLTFDRDGTGVTELSFPFIFSRCIKYDRNAKFTSGEVKNPFNEVTNEKGTITVRDTKNLSDITMNQGDQNWMKSNSFWNASL